MRKQSKRKWLDETEYMMSMYSTALSVKGCHNQSARMHSNWAQWESYRIGLGRGTTWLTIDEIIAILTCLFTRLRRINDLGFLWSRDGSFYILNSNSSSSIKLSCKNGSSSQSPPTTIPIRHQQLPHLRQPFSPPTSSPSIKNMLFFVFLAKFLQLRISCTFRLN